MGLFDSTDDPFEVEDRDPDEFLTGDGYPIDDVPPDIDGLNLSLFQGDVDFQALSEDFDMAESFIVLDFS